MFPSSVLEAYELPIASTKVEAFGNGLINHTWKLTNGKDQFILQRINENVFADPEAIAKNIQMIAEHLQLHHPEYQFVKPVFSNDGQTMVHMEGEGYFRLFPFVKNSHSKNIVKTSSQAYEAAVQFGRFTRMLKDFDPAKLMITIPHFHDLSLRYLQFRSAIKNGDSERINGSKDLIETLLQHADIVSEYERIRTSQDFKIRVTHHDTKISNVLFNEQEKGLCVIDLDTLMPGYFFSDVGDMMRTYLSPVDEEEKDFTQIEIRKDFYDAIVQGYLDEMREELTMMEKQYFFYAGKFMIYMQALRFLADHLNCDRYYGAKYPDHNFMRAKNQVVLLQKFIEAKEQ